MTIATAKRMPHAALTTSLLSDLAPELALRWAAGEAAKPPQERCTLPAALYRGLISLMLRAANRYEADAAYDVLRGALVLPIETPGAPLGFTSQTDTASIAEVLIDIAVTAARDEVLQPDSPALRHYADAGPGAGDAAEYHNASSEQRAAFAEQSEDLNDVRTLNLAVAIHYVAEIFERDGATGRYLSDAVSRNSSKWLQPFTDTLRINVQYINPKLRDALRRMYAAYMNSRNPAERTSMASTLAISITNVCNDPKALSLYIESIGSPHMKFLACRICLIQRFRVADKHTGPFSLDLLMNQYLTVKPVDGRCNRAVPALLAGLIMSWYENAPADGLNLHPTSPLEKSLEDKVVSYIGIMRRAKRRAATSFGASPREVVAFSTAVTILTNELIHLNSPP